MSLKIKIRHFRSKAFGFLTLTILLALNAHADDPSNQREQGAKQYGMTLPQFDAFTKRLEELKREYKEALKSPQAASQFQDALKKIIANIDAASKPATTKGNNLPTSFTDLFCTAGPSTTKGDEAVMKSGFMGLSADDRLDQFTLMWGVFPLLNEAPELLMPVLQERAKVFPPTAADYILYATVTEAINDNSYDMVGPNGSGDVPQVPPSRSAGLLTLAQAKNPIYRLLAVEAAQFVEPDKAKRLSFYSAYSNETDPFIQAAAKKAIQRLQK